MKTILCILLIAFVSGCNEPPKEASNLPQWHILAKGNAMSSVYETTIEGCQYIAIGHGLTHKGNCTNSIHCYNK